MLYFWKRSKTASSTSVTASVDNDDSLSTIENGGSDDRLTCSICLEPYRINDDVSWSKSLICRHVFHRHCIEQWLMKHKECPYCRCRYLGDDAVNDEQVVEGHHILSQFRRKEVVSNPASCPKTVADSAKFCITHGLLMNVPTAKCEQDCGSPPATEATDYGSAEK